MEEVRKIWNEALDELPVGATRQQRILAFALMLLAEDNVYYGIADDLIDSNLCSL